MKKAVIVDSNYGSVSVEEQKHLCERLLEHGIQLELYSFVNEEDIISFAADAEMILCTGNPPITERVLTALPKLKGVLRMGIGVNSVDVDAATKLNKVVMFMPGFCITELAAHASAMILSLYRNLRYYDSRMQQGKWPKAEYFKPVAIKSQKIGLLGFGGSAQELYKIFRFGFGCEILAYDPYFPDARKSNYEVSFVDFDTIVRESDVLSLHLPLNSGTEHIINHEVFKQMKNTAMLINISRGGLVDQAALVEALDAGEIRFAGLDVFEKEPLGADSPLYGRDNVILTSHSAFYGEEATKNQLNWAYEMTKNFLINGEVLRSKTANPESIAALGMKQI